MFVRISVSLSVSLYLCVFVTYLIKGAVGQGSGRQDRGAALVQSGAGLETIDSLSLFVCLPVSVCVPLCFCSLYLWPFVYIYVFPCLSVCLCVSASLRLYVCHMGGNEKL